MERIITVGEAERKAKEYIYEENESVLYEYINEILTQEKVVGSVDDFHNLAVDFSKMDDYETACNVLEKGLAVFPRAVDLLADYLQNGINCNRIGQCKIYFERLLGIPKMRWTWRGFSFCIDYMRNMADFLETEDVLREWKEEMLSVADDYYKYFPCDEDVFLVKADVYQYFNNKVDEIGVLDEALKQLKACPRCSLRLADIYFEKGEYDVALEYIERCRVESVRTQEKINQSYMYYLSGLCKVAKIHQDSLYNDENLIMDVYMDFCIAQKMKLTFSAYKKVIERQIDILETKSGVLYDLVD